MFDKATIEEMREWLSTLTWDDDDIDEVLAISTDAAIVRAIERTYDGGTEAFMKGCWSF